MRRLLDNTLESSATGNLQVTLNRLIALNDHKPINKHAKRGIFFAPAKEVLHSNSISVYNQGCPLEQWQIVPETVAQNSFQVFVTGDAFSVISPNIVVSGAQITIHVGLQHPKYSRLVLLQEALQLCRCAYEHGAWSITVALPDALHPIARANDFNRLLMSLFKVSGANNLYYYDNSYQGKLDESNTKQGLPLTISNRSDPDQYIIDRRELSAYLLPSEDASLDRQVLHFSRERKFKRIWSKFAPNQSDIIPWLAGKESITEIKVPESELQEHILLCCSANKPLALKIKESLSSRGEAVTLYDIEGEGEQAKIPEQASICGSVVTIVQSTRPNPEQLEKSHQYQQDGASAYLFEVLIIARQAQLRGAETINLINPYQFSARSDKAEDNPKGKTGAYVQHNGLLLQAAGVNQVITAECHDNHTMSGAYTGKKIRGSAVPALTIISTKLASEWLEDRAHPMQGKLRLVTPDAGAAKRTKELTEILEAILGSRLCQQRVLGEKHRDSHNDNSALISSMNSGSIGINPNDKYLITDDETASGSTLCQAVESLAKNGAKNIAVVIVHNNISLDWLQRQLCLARFLYLGVNDLHFSDTQEMGKLASDYQDLVSSYASYSNANVEQVKSKVWDWFKDNVAKHFSDKSEEYLRQQFAGFQSIVTHLKSRVRIHTLAEEFANKVATTPTAENQLRVS